MKLKSFRVRKFRNIVDSGQVEVDDDATCLVGKNEAGKSGLLEALNLLNPSNGELFDHAEQYPKWLVVEDRQTGELSEFEPIEATFELAEELADIEGEIGPGALASSEVVAKRAYSGDLVVTADFDEAKAVAAVIKTLDKEAKALVKGVATASGLVEALEEVDEFDFEQLPSAFSDPAGYGSAVVACIESRLPKFFLFTNYSTLPGRVDLGDLIDGAAPSGIARSGLDTARALLALAQTTATQLMEEDYESRRAEIDAVQIHLTKQVFEYWKQNPDLEVSIDVDKKTVVAGQNKTAVTRFLEIRLRDKRTGYSNNFSQRSSGFQWFFSFLAAFSALPAGSAPVVLLDEPALTLHGRAQGDFLRFINERLAPKSQVLYSTHSPFMVEVDKLERCRIVEDKGPDKGGVEVSQDVLSGDADSLFPLQAALGYDIAQSLFIGPDNLVVEGTSDFIYLTILSMACRADDREVLSHRWRILPAGGATSIPTFVSLIGPHLDVTVFADADTKGMQKVKNMVTRGLLDASRLVLADAVTPNNSKSDTEDIFEPDEYLALYNETFNTSFKLTDLPPGDRIVKRLEALNGDFVHGEVSETLLRSAASRTFSDATLERFENLFKLLNSTLLPPTQA